MFSASMGADSEAQVGFLFHVMIGINPLGEFRSVKGIGRNVEKTEMLEGGRNHSPHTRVGQARYKECTIEWGMSNRTTLYDWIHAVEAGYGYKRLVWVIQLGRDRTPLRIYQLMDAWPISWEGAELDANNNVVDTEQITIAYEAVMLLTMPDTSVSLPAFNIPTIDVGDTQLASTGEDDLGFGTSGALSTTAEAEDADEQVLGPDLALSLDFFAVREEPVRLRFTTDPEEEDAENADEDEDEDDPGAQDEDDEGDEEDTDDPPTADASAPAADENTDEVAAPARAKPAPLKMSGGVSFTRTVFEPLSLSGAAADGTTEDTTSGGSDDGTATEPDDA